MEAILSRPQCVNLFTCGQHNAGHLQGGKTHLRSFCRNFSRYKSGLRWRVLVALLDVSHGSDDMHLNLDEIHINSWKFSDWDGKKKLTLNNCIERKLVYSL